MPQMQVVDLSPLPRQEPTVLEKTLGGFTKRWQENQEADVLGSIYQDYKDKGRNIEDAIIDIQTRRGLSPTARVNAASQLLDLKKATLAAQKTAIKDENKMSAAEKKAQIDLQKKQDKEAADENEIDFLASIEGKNLSPTQIYTQARNAKISGPRASALATLHRMEGKEGRLTSDKISKEYEYEIKDLDRRLKDVTLRTAERKKLQEEMDNLRKMRKADLERFRRGDKDFELSMHAGELAAQAEEQAAVPEEVNVVEQRIQTLTSKQKPSKENKGLIVKDKKTGLTFKSDGTKWLLIQE